MKTGTDMLRPRESGFSLVELMVVLVFIAIGILALSGVQTGSLTDVYATGRYTRALDLAQTRMETARAVGYTLAQSDSGAVDGFTWLCLVDSGGVAMKRVTTTVSWADNRRARSVRLMSLISSR
jgi:prepilin-type N-terminal cleavage/methylation domain-containing protein